MFAATLRLFIKYRGAHLSVERRADHVAGGVPDSGDAAAVRGFYVLFRARLR